nr:helix-turn-helix domain-containing protein [Trinickia dinghuensis]
MNIHRRIRDRRLELGLSMEALAELVGVRAWQTIQQWEKEDGGTAPKRDRLKKVSEALRTTPEYLLFGSPAPLPEIHGGDDALINPLRRMEVMASGADRGWMVDISALAPDSFLFLIPDDSMAPRFFRGDYAIVEPAVTPEVEDDVLVGFANGRIALMRLLSRRAGIRLGTWSDAAATTYSEPEIVWMHCVSGFVPARRIKRA